MGVLLKSIRKILVELIDRYVSEGRIPHGRKSPGFKELSWSLAELDSCKLNKC